MTFPAIKSFPIRLSVFLSVSICLSVFSCCLYVCLSFAHLFMIYLNQVSMKPALMAAFICTALQHLNTMHAFFIFVCVSFYCWNLGEGGDGGGQWMEVQQSPGC